MELKYWNKIYYYTFLRLTDKHEIVLITSYKYTLVINNYLVSIINYL